MSHVKIHCFDRIDWVTEFFKTGSKHSKLFSLLQVTIFKNANSILIDQWAYLMNERIK